jgi:hypothetical protein
MTTRSALHRASARASIDTTLILSDVINSLKLGAFGSQSSFNEPNCASFDETLTRKDGTVRNSTEPLNRGWVGIELGENETVLEQFWIEELTKREGWSLKRADLWFWSGIREWVRIGCLRGSEEFIFFERPLLTNATLAGQIVSVPLRVVKWLELPSFCTSNQASLFSPSWKHIILSAWRYRYLSR